MEMKEGEKRVGGSYYSQAERAPSVEEGGRWKVGRSLGWVDNKQPAAEWQRHLLCPQYAVGTRDPTPQTGFCKSRLSFSVGVSASLRPCVA